MTAVLYLLVSLCLTSFALGVIFLIAWTSYGRKPYALTWSLAFFVSTTQWILNIFQGLLFTDHRVYWIAANVPPIVAVSLALLGHRQRAGLKTPWPWLVGAGAATEAAIVWFTWPMPHIGLQMFIEPLFAAVGLGWIAVILLRHRERPLPAEWGAAIATALVAGMQAVAGFVALLQGSTADRGFQEIYSRINFLGLPAAFTAMGLFVVFILASDLAEQMKTLAMTDSLTGVANRRGFSEALYRALSQARREGTALSLVIADIDHFKGINDAHGHDVGDLALQAFARRLVDEGRASDLVGRLGGEEFGVLLPGADLERALEVAERMRQAVQSQEMVTPAGRVRVTCSFGVATMSERDVSTDHFFRRADQALFAGKAKGRNRVEAAA